MGFKTNEERILQSFGVYALLYLDNPFFVKIQEEEEGGQRATNPNNRQPLLKFCPKELF